MKLSRIYIRFYKSINPVNHRRSDSPLKLGVWHRIGVSRTGREASLTVDQQQPAVVTSSGAFTQLSLSQNLYLGGVPDYSLLSVYLPITVAFQGCIQKVGVPWR